MIEDRYAFSLASMISNMKIDGGDQSRHEYEDAWVILLATSFFRKVPFIPDAGNNGLVPVLVSVLERDARRQALEAEGSLANLAFF